MTAKLLSRLMANCGGKAINCFDGSAIVRFGCREDGLRAEQRFNNYHFCGQDITLELISDLDNCEDVQEFNICKSIIRGVNISKDLTNEEVFKKVVNQFNGDDINVIVDVIEMIAKIDRKDNCLVITAVTPADNHKLLSYAKKYLSSAESTIDWSLAERYVCFDER